jgi:hypothetical protein
LDTSSSNPLTNKEANNPFAGTNENPMTVNATIKNSAGAEVGKVDLKYLSDRNYLGIWKANVAAGSIMQASLQWHQANPTYMMMPCRLR